MCKDSSKLFLIASWMLFVWNISFSFGNFPSFSNQKKNISTAKHFSLISTKVFQLFRVYFLETFLDVFEFWYG